MNIDTLHGIINAVERVRVCKQELSTAERHLETIAIKCDHRYPNGTDACLSVTNPDGTRTCAVCHGTTARPQPIPRRKPAKLVFQGAPIISVDRMAQSVAIFDDSTLIGDFEPYTVEAEAVAEAKARIEAVTKKEIEVIYPRITKMTTR